MGTWNPYTEYEDSVILSCVQKNPQHWNTYLKKRVKGFSLKSDSTEVVNRKNIPEKKELRGAEYHLNALIEILQAKRDTLDTVISTLKSIEL